MPSEPVWVCLPVSDGISRKKRLGTRFQAFCVTGLFLVFADDFLQLGHGAVTALSVSVGENDGRRAVESELFAQRSSFCNRIFTVAATARELTLTHPVCPCLDRVGLAPKDLCFAFCIRVEAGNRHHEVVNRDVGHFFEFVFQTFAERAVRIREDSNLQLAAAANLFNRFI